MRLKRCSSSSRRASSSSSRGRGGAGGGGTWGGGGLGWGGRLWAKKGGEGVEEGGGRGKGGQFGKNGKVCKVCLQTAQFAPSSVNAASCRLGVLHEKQNACPPSPLQALWRAFFGALKGGKKGGFTSDSSNTPLGRRKPVEGAFIELK